jgi:threonine dehydrogenase-like Zn-dependent dehydrogenase
MYAYAGAGLFGYSHLYGGYAGGQADYVRVPFIDVGALPIPDAISDEEALFLSDILPTGWMAAENCGLEGGETVAVWGCGPVGQFAIVSAYLQGAARVIAIDRVPARLRMAEDMANAETIDYADNDDVVETLKEMTGGRGPDACIDAVGLEAHGSGVAYAYDRAKHALRLQSDRPYALREAIQACGPGGVVSIPGVYAAFADKFPIGIAFGKGLTLRMGQTHVHRYMLPLLERIARDDFDPTFVITHRVSLGDASEAYRTFRDKEDSCIKVVMTP